MDRTRQNGQMASSSTARGRTGRTGRPPVTSREQILAAALHLIETDGWQSLTIRRLAADLGIGTTTLYHHVRDREDLLVQLIGHVVAQIDRPELPTEPRERIVVVMTTARDTLAAMPWAAEVLTVDGFMGRLGDTSVWIVEAVLAAVVEAGSTPERAVEVFRHLWYYTAGEILVRARTAVGPIDRDRLLPEGQTLFGSRDATELPTVAAVGDQWPQIAARDTYTDGLRALVAGLLGPAATSGGG